MASRYTERITEVEWEEEEVDEWLQKQREEQARRKNELRRSLLAKAVDDWMDSVVIRAELVAKLANGESTISTQSESQLHANGRNKNNSTRDVSKSKCVNSSEDELCRQMDNMNVTLAGPSRRLPWTSTQHLSKKPFKDGKPPIPHIQIRYEDPLNIKIRINIISF